MSLRKLPLSLVVLLGASSIAAQKERAPVDLPGTIPDPGAKVEMFESTSLDRFLRRARRFLERRDYAGAIEVLQSVVEGRTGEFADPEEEARKKKEEEEKAKAAAKAKRSGRPKKPELPKEELPIDEENPKYSVFSSDERIYRPVARLCHELLASMPPEGIGLYRVRYENQAEVALAEATAKGDLAALEAVYSNYFTTLSAARAMAAAVDLLMDSGRFRAALQTLDNLLEVYPEPARREAGLRDLELRVKAAICYQQLGESDLAKEHITQTGKLFPEASVRLMGELYTVKDLGASELFDDRAVAKVERRAPALALDLLRTDQLRALWEFRFTEMNPYKSQKSRQSGTRYYSSRVRKRVHGTQFPSHREQMPGTTVSFHDGAVTFLDHFRPVIHDPMSGRQLMALGEGELARMRQPSSDTVPRARIPAYDWFDTRVASDGARYFVIEGYNGSTSTSSFNALHQNTLVAYEERTGKQVWRWLSTDTANKKRSITFLATPTVHRNNLLLPFLDAGIYGILCLRAADGVEVYRTYLHSGGTDFARAPSPQVVVSSGVAYCLTNAGVLGAVDANTGQLSWSRRYERVHPQRGKATRRSTRRNSNMWGGYAFVATVGRFRGFAPGDLYVAGDHIILAPADGTVLLCLNSANGAVLWMHDAAQSSMHSVLPDKLTHVVGHNGSLLFVMVGNNHLMCIGLRNGVRYWLAAVPGTEGDWRGRGCVTRGYVLIPGRPGARQVHAIAAEAKGPPTFRTLALPEFSIGKGPLPGPANLFAHDAYLAVAYEGGIEFYSTADALSRIAAGAGNPTERARVLLHAGKLQDALQVLGAELERKDLDAAARSRFATRALSIAGELATRKAKAGNREAALAVLDQVAPKIDEPRLELRLHLLRLQVFRALNDPIGAEREQEFIETGGVKK